jgi:hypothetical protein
VSSPHLRVSLRLRVPFRSCVSIASVCFSVRLCDSLRLSVSTSPVCLHFTGPSPLRCVFSLRSGVLCFQFAFVFSLRLSVLTSPSVSTSLVRFHFAGVLPLRSFILPSLRMSASLRLCVPLRSGVLTSLVYFESPLHLRVPLRWRVPFRSCGCVSSVRLGVLTPTVCFHLGVCFHFACLAPLRLCVPLPPVWFAFSFRLRFSLWLRDPLCSCVLTSQCAHRIASLILGACTRATAAHHQS